MISLFYKSRFTNGMVVFDVMGLALFRSGEKKTGERESATVFLSFRTQVIYFK